MQFNKEQKKVLNNFVDDYIDSKPDSTDIDRVEFASIVREMVSKRMNNNMTFNEAVANLDLINLKSEKDKKQIIEKSITEDNENEREFNIHRFTSASLIMIPWWILGFVVGMIGVSAALIGLAAFFLPVYGVLAFWILDLGPAFAVFFTTLGAAPVLMFIFYWIFGLIWEVLKQFINVSARLYNPDTTMAQTLSKINFLKTGAKANWTAIIILGVLFVGMFSGSLVGSIVPKNGFIYTSMNDKFLHKQEIDIDLLEELNEGNSLEINAITFKDIRYHNNFPSRPKFIDDTSLVEKNHVKITFKYSTKKQNDKLKYELKYNVNNKEITIKFKYNDLEPIMNIVGYKYAVRYNI